jgi:hypothetical protein
MSRMDQASGGGSNWSTVNNSEEENVQREPQRPQRRARGQQSQPEDYHANNLVS